jgi:hypothetical protein
VKAKSTITAFLFKGAALAILMVTSLTASSQNWPFELWHEGKIVLNAGDTLKGYVKYDMQQDLVQYSLDERKSEVYTARKVLYFEIFDNTVHKYRRFFTLPYAANSSYRTPIFFELLEEGKMTLLAREHLEYKTYNSPYYIGSFSRLVLTNKFFFLQDDGTIEEFRGSRSDLLDLMGRQADAVDKYMRTNNLRFDEKQDIAQIVGYYNSLVGS